MNKQFFSLRFKIMKHRVMQTKYAKWFWWAIATIDITKISFQLNNIKNNMQNNILAPSWCKVSYFFPNKTIFHTLWIWSICSIFLSGWTNQSLNAKIEIFTRRMKIIFSDIKCNNFQSITVWYTYKMYYWSLTWIV